MSELGGISLGLQGLFRGEFGGGALHGLSAAGAGAPETTMCISEMSFSLCSSLIVNNISVRLADLSAQDRRFRLQARMVRGRILYNRILAQFETYLKPPVTSDGK